MIVKQTFNFSQIRFRKPIHHLTSLYSDAAEVFRGCRVMGWSSAAQKLVDNRKSKGNAQKQKPSRPDKNHNLSNNLHNTTPSDLLAEPGAHFGHQASVARSGGNPFHFRKQLDGKLLRDCLHKDHVLFGEPVIQCFDVGR